MEELYISLIQYLPWPIVVLICFFMLKDHIWAIASRLKRLKAGSIELQMNDQFQVQGFTKEQLEKIALLTTEEIDLFLMCSYEEGPSFNYNLNLPKELFKERILKLESIGLLLVPNPENDGSDLIHNLTKLGRKTRDLLVSSSTQLIRNAAEKNI